MPFNTILLALPLVTLLAAASHLAIAKDSAPAATPYRPSLANPAELPAPGWLEFEAGWQRLSGGEDPRRDSLPVMAKLAFSERRGAFAELDAGTRAGTAATRQYMLGGSCSLNPRLVLDLGVACGLTAASADWSVAFDVTGLAAHLW
jgi:hypothetical protein